MPRIGTTILPPMLLVMSDGPIVRGANVEPSLIEAQVGIKAANVIVQTLAHAAASGLRHKVVQIDVADLRARSRTLQFQLPDDFGSPPEINAASGQVLHPGTQPIQVPLLAGVVDVEFVCRPEAADVGIEAEFNAQLGMFAEINRRKT